MDADADSSAGRMTDRPSGIDRCPECGADARLERTPPARSWRDWRRRSALLIAAVVGGMYLAAGWLVSESWSDATAAPPFFSGSRTAHIEIVGDGITLNELKSIAESEQTEGPLTDLLREASEVEESFPGRARIWFDFASRYRYEETTESYGWPVWWYQAERKVNLDHRREMRFPGRPRDQSDSYWFEDIWVSTRDMGGGVRRHRAFHLGPLLLTISISVLGAYGLPRLLGLAPLRWTKTRTAGVVILLLLLLVLNVIRSESSTERIGTPARDVTTFGRTYSVSRIQHDVSDGPTESMLAGLLLRRWGSVFMPGRDVLHGAVLNPREIQAQSAGWTAPFWFAVPQVSSMNWIDTSTGDKVPIGRTDFHRRPLPLPQRIRVDAGMTRYEIHIAWGYLAFILMTLVFLYRAVRFVTDRFNRQQDRKRRRDGRCVICGYRVG
jgi:hypothetical protein